MKKTTILTLLLATALTASAQNIKTVGATYTYVAAPNEGIEQARRHAIEQAQTEALRKEFGSAVSGASATALIEKNGIAKSKFVQLSSEGEVNGEWVGDLIEPVLVEELKDGVLYIMATVKGKGQEVTNNKIEYEAYVLRNVPDLKFKSTEFEAGNEVYVSFKAPCDGYLAIYLLDGDNAYRLLPYRSSSEGAFRIIHDQQYIFFSPKKATPEENPNDIDEYTLTAEDELADLNQFYFIFSPNRFQRGVDVSNKMNADQTLELPPEQTWGAFQKWILKVRKRDKEMSVQTQYVTIKPKQ